MSSKTGNNNKTEKRSIGLQTIVPFNEQLNPKIAASFRLEEEEYPRFVTIPHTISTLFLTLTILYYVAFSNPYDGPDVFSNNKMSVEEENLMFDRIFFYLKAILAVICVIGVTYFPDSIVRRPHPAFWRLVYSVGIFYLLVIIFFSTLTRNDARYLLKIFDRDLNQKPHYKSYGENCGIFTEEYPYVDLGEIWKAFDMYIIAHLLGWFVKYLALRSFRLSIFLSLLFELLELTFRHWLPNFIECWWDHIILDFLGMNLLGIVLGYYVVRFFNMKSYKWLASTTMNNNNSNLSQNQIQFSNSSNIKKDNKKQNPCTSSGDNMIKYFTPTEVIIYEWEIFSSSWRFLSVLWFCIIFNLCDLSHFFMKTILWLPITHWTLAFRIFLWGFMCILSAREYYEYITNNACKKLGQFVWLTQTILFVEWMIILKFGQGMFTAPFPETVVYSWTAALVIISVVVVRLIVKDLIEYFKGEKPKDVDRSSILVEYHN